MRNGLQMSPLSAQELAQTDREFLRSQERDRMNERTQLWTIFLSLASGFGFIAVQGSELSYLTGLFPILLVFLALHIRNSEDTLKQIRKYLYQQEQAACYQGYEHFTRAPENSRTSHGGYKKALCGAFSTTGLLAVSLVIYHLVLAHVPLPFIMAVALVEVAAMMATWSLLTDRKKRQPSRPSQEAFTC